ncbi:hypothetical protein [Arthrobacter sp. CAN_C5]|uniref:hypothetical protein n=1 Tax=Arthrobacter sp. CAN_C5 TaxID=2760706 RepID=UPI001AE940EC|nr:hypothetical protein [Arthrobacter sp. CAN_C5]MBP2215980.1 hypothetical protein [Arthrobacter sp. CAN_C5]
MIDNETLTQMAIANILIVVAIVLIAVLLRWFGVTRARKKLSDADLDRIREELVEYMQSVSANRGQAKPLKLFWKGKRLSRTSKWLVVDRLLKEDIICAEAPNKTEKADGTLFDEIAQWLGGLLDKFLAWLVLAAPGRVFLSDRDWDFMMAKHLSARNLLEERNVIIVNGDGNVFGRKNKVKSDFSRDDRSRSKVKAGGDVSGSNVTGDSEIHTRWQAGSRKSEDLKALAAALRSDAENLGPDHCEIAHKLASNVDEKADQQPHERNDIEVVLQRVASFAAPLATVLTETHRILKSFWPTTQE